MSTPPKDIWTLHSTDPNGKELNGCHIVFTGTTFDFTEPDPNKVLATMPGQLTPTIPFTFPVFAYKDTEWAIVLWRLPNEADGSGTWATSGRKLTATRRHSGGKETDPQSGDFTAMNGGAGDPEEATYRAKA
jgi:hypothetical protein